MASKIRGVGKRAEPFHFSILCNMLNAPWQTALVQSSWCNFTRVLRPGLQKNFGRRVNFCFGEAAEPARLPPVSDQLGLVARSFPESLG